MNHDVTHCIDFRSDCPKDCYRAQLVRDLEEKMYLKNKPDHTWILSYAYFKGTEECLRKD